MARHPERFIQRSSMLNVINGVGYFLRWIGLDPFKLNAEDIVGKVQGKAACSISIQSAEEGLSELVKSINSEGHPNPFGALI